MTLTAKLNRGPASSAADATAGLVCVVCGGRLMDESGGRRCGTCLRHYPTLAGIPDFRLANDRYLSLDEERAKALKLAALDDGRCDLESLVAAYYAMTADVDDRRRAGFSAHIRAAERRGASLVGLLPKAGRILEVGCGSGGFLAAGLERGRDVVGVDIGLRWLVMARRRLSDRRLSATLVAASADQLPWPDRHFDAVVADSVLEHTDDPIAALAEFRRVLKPGGRLLIWSPNRRSLLRDPHVFLFGVGWLPRAWAERYVRWRRGEIWLPTCLTPDEARQAAKQAGFREIQVEPVEIPASWVRSGWPRRALALASFGARVPGLRSALRSFGPLWQLTGVAR